MNNESDPQWTRPAAHPNPGALRLLDLTGSDRQLRSAMSVMNRVALRFARAARRTLPFLVRRRSRITPGPVTIAESAVTSPGPRSGPLFTVTLEAENGPAWGHLSLNAEALALVLEGALGGGANGSGASLGAELTLAQRALVSRIGRSLAEDFSAALKEEVGLVLRIVQLEALSSADPVQLPGADGLAVDCSFENASGSPLVSVTVSAEALQAAAKELNSFEPSHGDPRMNEAMQEVTLEMVAELGRVGLGLREVLSLSVGQVIRLSAAVDDPVTVRVGGLPKLLGVPVISRGQLSVEIRGRVLG
jgi:flagellar motor switch protein FliM